MDYISKLVEAKALLTNNARVVLGIITKYIFKYRKPQAIIRDVGTHFCTRLFTAVLYKYRVQHRVTIVCHILKQTTMLRVQTEVEKDFETHCKCIVGRLIQKIR